MRKKLMVLTGGHLTPALAMIEVLRSEGWEIVYFGQQDSDNKFAEAEIIPGMGIKFIGISAGKLHRKISFQALVSLVKIPWGLGQSFYWLAKLRPQALVSFGGYLGLPAVISARVLGIPSIIHEQTIVAGLANRLSSRFSHRVAITFPESRVYFPAKKTVVTGNPVQKSLFMDNKSLYKQVTTGFRKKLTLMVMGGNQGSKLINQTILSCLPELLEKYNLIHVVGNSSAQEPEWQQSQQFLSQLPPDLKGNYRPLRYFNPDQRGTYFQIADLVISRSGANTVYDLGIFETPAILIPLEPSLMNEQLENAQMLKNRGLAIVLREADLTAANLMVKISQALSQTPKLQLAPEAKNWFIRDGADRLYREIKQLLRPATL